MFGPDRKSSSNSSSASVNSPYQPLRSPSATRRAREHQRNNSSNRGDDVYATESGADLDGDSDLLDLVSLNTLLETITRAMARRVFELHRGSKNKRMMASKQHELSKRT